MKFKSLKELQATGGYLNPKVTHSPQLLESLDLYMLNYISGKAEKHQMEIYIYIYIHYALHILFYLSRPSIANSF